MLVCYYYFVVRLFYVVEWCAVWIITSFHTVTEWSRACLVSLTQTSQKSLTTQNTIVCLAPSCYSTFTNVSWQACEMISSIVWGQIYIKCLEYMSEIVFLVVLGLLMFILWCGQFFHTLEVHDSHHISLFFQKEKPLTSANVKFSVDWPSLPFLPLCGHWKPTIAF